MKFAYNKNGFPKPQIALAWEIEKLDQFKNFNYL